MKMKDGILGKRMLQGASKTPATTVLEVNHRIECFKDSPCFAKCMITLEGDLVRVNDLDDGGVIRPRRSKMAGATTCDCTLFTIHGIKDSVDGNTLTGSLVTDGANGLATFKGVTPSEMEINLIDAKNEGCNLSYTVVSGPRVLGAGPSVGSVVSLAVIIVPIVVMVILYGLCLTRYPRRRNAADEMESPMIVIDYGHSQQSSMLESVQSSAHSRPATPGVAIQINQSAAERVLACSNEASSCASKAEPGNNDPVSEV